MKIIELTEEEYRDFVNSNDMGNVGQTLEYSEIQANRRKKKLFLGLVDDNEEMYAATLILIRSISSTVKEAVSPNGFIIDYANYQLVNTFTKLLREKLFKERVTYLITNPMFKYHVYNKKNIEITNNESIYSNLLTAGFRSIGYYSDFGHYDVVIDNPISSNDIYHNFNRNTKRNINEALNLGITLHKGSISDLSLAYEMIKKKNKRTYEFYENIMNIYNNKDNKAEIFFAKLNSHQYLVNIKRIYEKEKIKNEKIRHKFELKAGRINDRLLNMKINSDNTLEKYNQKLNDAIELNQKYKGDIVVGTSIIIKNNREIYFLADGYNEEFRRIHSTHILKWAIIRKYFADGYHIFNLGEIHKDYFDKSSKYYGQYKYKIGFGGNIVEYSPNLLLIVNKPMYSLYKKINHK